MSLWGFPREPGNLVPMVTHVVLLALGLGLGYILRAGCLQVNKVLQLYQTQAGHLFLYRGQPGLRPPSPTQEEKMSQPWVTHVAPGSPPQPPALHQEACGAAPDS